MPIQDLLLIFTAGVTFAVGLLVGIRDRHNIANIMYFFLTFFMSSWAISLLMFRTYNANDVSEFFGRFSYIAGLLMIISFYLFTRYFPYRDRMISGVTTVVLTLISVITIITMLYTDFLVIRVVVINGVVSAVTNPVVHSIYGLILLIFLISGLANLFLKKHNSGGSHRKQLNSIFVMSLVAGFFGAVFDIILPIFGDYRWNWLGPQFLILFTIAVGIIIFSPRLTTHD